MRNGKTEILDSQTICKQTDRYIGWPTVGVLPGCELIAVFSGDRDAHADPFGKSFLIRSADKGTTWSTPVLINDTPLDDRDTGLCVCRDGTVVMTWFTSHYDKKSYLDMAPAGLAERWTEKIDSVTMEDIKNWANEKIEEGRYELGKWIRSSADGGHTWSEPVRVPVTTPHGPVELSDGRLMFLGIDGIYGRRRKENSIVAVESPDRGRTWTILGKVNMYPPYRGIPDVCAFLCEPHVVELSPGKLLGMARYEEFPRRDPRCCVLWQFTSDDGGCTWTEPRPTAILGKPPHLCKLADGRILLTYGYRHEPYGQRACLSEDGGKRWNYDREIVLRDDAPSGDLGYPASVEIEDGTVVTVYYQQEHFGDKTCLMATRWRPGD